MIRIFQSGIDSVQIGEAGGVRPCAERAVNDGIALLKLFMVFAGSRKNTVFPKAPHHRDR